MASKYDDYWIKRLDVISDLIQEARERGVSRSIDVSDITKYGERKNWYGEVIVSEKGISKGEMAHTRSLGRIVFANKLINVGEFRFVITSNLRLRVEKLKASETVKKAYIELPAKLTPKLSSDSVSTASTVLSLIPIEVWNKIVQEEPEWKHMRKFLESYGFGRFAVLMVATGLNDFQLKGKAEVAYWPKICRVLKAHKVPDSIQELKSILSEFYANERLPELKLRRLNRFLSSRLAEWLWNAEPKELAENFLKIWYDLAATMRQKKDAKTIVFAMKCLGIALLMAGESNFNFERIPIPVDYRVREFTKRLGVTVRDDEDVRNYWGRVLGKLRENGLEVNMIHLDSLIWQIGVLSKAEILDYFSKLGLRDVGERIVEVVR
jgi:DNA-(apurinic or apyrimidinic site) lyase